MSWLKITGRGFCFFSHSSQLYKERKNTGIGSVLAELRFWTIIISKVKLLLNFTSLQ